MSHGFYAMMGGFAVDVPNGIPEAEQFLPLNTEGFRFLSPHGIRIVLDVSPDEIRDISPEELESKSKANMLAKSLTLAQRIPISLLELNTFGHAICALVIYLLWWEKPFEVDYPILLQGPNLRKLQALTFMQEYEPSAKSDIDVILYLVSRRKSTSEQYEEIQERRRGIRELRKILTPSHQNLKYHKTESTNRLDRPKSKFEKYLLRAIDEAGVFPEYREEYTRICDEFRDIHISTTEMNRFDMATQIAEKSAQVLLVKNSDSQRALIERYKNWPNDPEFLAGPFISGFIAAAIFYGGLHILAWSAHFRSSYEQLFWRISACLVVGGLPVIYTLLLSSLWVRDIYHDRGCLWSSPWSRFIRDVLRCFLWGSSLLVLVAYIAARAYLVVECFINLSHLPAGVFDMPKWSAYFPHIA
ncbi:MAG: hypothetical protein Q9186_000124 [Xanthomendoza sp. 1 TL-2023]